MPVVRWLTGGQGRPAAMVTAVLLAAWYGLLGNTYWYAIQTYVFDTYQRAFPRQIEQLPVTIIDIDDASIAALGQWPWGRHKLAQLTEATHQLGALAVGLDIIMPEVDGKSPEVVLMEERDNLLIRDFLEQRTPNDVILAKALRQIPSVVGRAGVAESENGAVSVAMQTPVRVYGDEPVAHVPTFAGHLTNLPVIEQAASGHGYLNATPSVDGVIREAPLLVAVDGNVAPTFAVELLRVALGEALYSVYSDTRGVQGVRLGEAFIPTEADGSIRLYYSIPQVERRISALAILRGEANPERLVNHVAIIGVTGVGVEDTATTPVTSHMDGVEIQAQLIENMLEGSRLIRPSRAPAIELSGFIGIAIVLIFFLPRLRPGYGLGLFLGGASLLAAGGVIAFVQARWLIDPSFPIAGNAMVLVVLLTSGLAAANRRRQELRRQLEEERYERLRVAGELRAARDIQMGIVPSPEAIEGLPKHIDFYALLEPAQDVGGDLYDAFMLDEQHFFFLIGDVAGKGVPASLFMALSKALCKSIALREQLPLHELMTLVNRNIARENPADFFITVVVGVLNVRTGEVTLCNAGHDAPILLRAGSPPRSLDAVGGLPLCFLEDFPYISSTLQLQSGDMLVLITDGVTEAHNPEQQLYGMERVLTCLTALPQDDKASGRAALVCQKLYEDVTYFVNRAAPFDDITISVIRFTMPCAPDTPENWQVSHAIEGTTPSAQ